MGWKIDNTHSSVGFSVRHMVFAKVRGTFGSWEAELDLRPEDVSKSSVKARIDVASIDTGVGQRDGHLRSADFFDAETHPRISFESRRVTGSGERFYVQGDLTIRGVTKPVTLEVETLGRGKDPWGNQRVGFLATTKVDRREFGLTWNQALETGGVLVGEHIDVEINLQAVADAQDVKKAG